MKETHPAMVAARNSWRCVQGKLKDEWLGLMAEDVVIEDPIGRSLDGEIKPPVSCRSCPRIRAATRAGLRHRLDT